MKNRLISNASYRSLSSKADIFEYEKNIEILQLRPKSFKLRWCRARDLFESQISNDYLRI